MPVADHADQRIGQAVAAQMSFRRIADLCGVLLNLRVTDEELRSRAHDIISRAMRPEDERNTIIHSAWAVAEDGSAIRMKMRARRKHGVRRPAPNPAMHLERVVASDVDGDPSGEVEVSPRPTSCAS